MKRFFSILAALLLFAVPLQADAAGLFDSIVAEYEQQESPAALPSYSVFSGVPAYSESTDGEKTAYAYRNVSLEAFRSFGEYLADLGFEITRNTRQGSVHFLELARPSDPEGFIVVFHAESLRMETVYPAGSERQACAFLDRFPGLAAEGEGPVRTDSRSDSLGNSYSTAFSLDSGTASVPLEGAFSTFRGTVSFPAGIRESDSRESASFTVRSGETVLYTSPEMGPGSAPVPFSIDVSGVETLEITWKCTGRSFLKDWGSYATIYNGIFF